MASKVPAIPTGHAHIFWWAAPSTKKTVSTEEISSKMLTVKKLDVIT
jgi:hypothetical protein